MSLHLLCSTIYIIYIYTYIYMYIYKYIYIYIYIQKLKSQKLDALEWILNKKTNFQSSQIFRLFYITFYLVYLYIYIYEHMYKYTLQVCCFIWGGVLWYCITWKLQCWNKEQSKKIQQNHSVRETWHWAIFLPICTKFLTFPNFLRY